MSLFKAYIRINVVRTSMRICKKYNFFNIEINCYNVLMTRGYVCMCHKGGSTDDFSVRCHGDEPLKPS